MRSIFAGIDIETSGTEYTKHAVIQIGIVTEDGFEFVSDVRPEGEYEWQEEARAVNGFSNERVDAAPTQSLVDLNLSTAVNEFYGSEQTRLIAVGFNVGTFDLPFIIKSFPLFQKRLSYRAVDLNSVLFTIDRARRGMKGVFRYDGLKKRAKEFAAERLATKGEETNWHDALFDAKAGLLAWEYLRGKVMVTD